MMRKNQRQHQINAFLGKDTEFEGKLTFSGAVRIDGHFKGEILTGGTLIVGETALLECNIQTAYVIVCGEVHGNIIAQKEIEIHAPGRVFGDITAPVVKLDEGVIFEGNCRMQKNVDEEDNKIAVLHNEKVS